MIRYRQLLNGLWLAWALYWIVAAYGSLGDRSASLIATNRTRSA